MSLKIGTLGQFYEYTLACMEAHSPVSFWFDQVVIGTHSSSSQFLPPRRQETMLRLVACSSNVIVYSTANAVE